jgi:hypothetical protein
MLPRQRRRHRAFKPRTFHCPYPLCQKTSTGRGGITQHIRIVHDRQDLHMAADAGHQSDSPEPEVRWNQGDFPDDNPFCGHGQDDRDDSPRQLGPSINVHPYLNGK